MPAFAGDADDLFQKGMADLEAGRLDTACPALRKSFRFEKRPTTLFHLAECEDRAGRIATAALHYDEYLDLFERLSPPEQQAEGERERKAFKRRETLDGDIPRVTFRLPESAPVGTKVTRVTKQGGDPVPVALGVALPIDPGEHWVMTQPPGGARWEKRFFVQKGDRQTIALSVSSPDDDAKMVRYSRPLEPVPALLPPEEYDNSGRRIATWTAGGIGAAGVVTGIVTGAVAWSQKGVVNSNCRDGLCNTKGESAADLASTMGTVSTIAFPIGLAGLAVAVVLILTEPEQGRLGAAPQRAVIGRAAPAIDVSVSRQGDGFVGATWIW
ncbi:tetratricopeptide repeat protein [Chondromyces apiculatus]|uniref:Tetratricopeptide repeat protein n=1 Tax=Chondromyces apiculatus DSM 436 TaxID=1192034 RepID=A0A017T0Y6_9BACT|nr:hypothetical protein [Chondromyces apiculatus]EYF02888.1 Hypothetical protein CAP_6468 [Chondromyces apiculatus DSM 436]